MDVTILALEVHDGSTPDVPFGPDGVLLHPWRAMLRATRGGGG
ncbi:MAG TPA: hypothetical protein VFU19_09695 [Iamia sp.]|nr:hypothetical protein [Iamia sp.]